MIRHWWQFSFVSTNSFSKVFYNKGRLRLEVHSAASSGGQSNLTYFTYIPWPPLEAGLSISTFCSLDTTHPRLCIRSQMYVYSTINHTQQAILYTLSWRLVLAQERAFIRTLRTAQIVKIQNSVYIDFSVFTVLVTGQMMACSWAETSRHDNA
jgi:hypothetical protein